MCQLKILVGLQSLARYNVKHHRCTYTTPNALDMKMPFFTSNKKDVQPQLSEQ